MQVDPKKAEELTLALMYLASFKEGSVVRTWKGYDWDVMNRLAEQGLISNPVGKAKSVVLTEEGEARSRAMAEKYLGAA
jgi:hypothetical protein